MDFYPGIDSPTDHDQVGLAVAEEQLELIHNLREIRIRRGLSVTQVAEAMGIDASQVSRFESGSTNPTMSTIRRYAKTVRAVFRIRTLTWEEDCDHRAAEGGSEFSGSLLPTAPQKVPAAFSASGSPKFIVNGVTS
ncbi:helix-turn-helix domain-containing protein [Nocardia sp. alder85J]|uniref:helix-turn-helix domain-containing protein n=1 Tax=Nocardia sp. alder85J TaxID=2862949 RepID=UPI001CD345A7|nr:helix-turn-helix transcriptional regulator [Nocardia sp. alder85J]MCX4095300.1 helix-turn-helix transcriptional regulator [Nocardia sp. alder85J]